MTELSRLVLNVDLWSQKGDREDNCVKHSNVSPSIGTTSLSAYPQIVTPMTQTQPPQIYTGHSVPYSSPGIISPNSITPGSASSYFPNEEQHAYGGQNFRSRPPSFSMDRPTDRFGAQYPNGFGEGYGARVNGSSQIQPLESSGRHAPVRTLRKEDPRSLEHMLRKISSGVRLRVPSG